MGRGSGIGLVCLLIAAFLCVLATAQSTCQYIDASGNRFDFSPEQAAYAFCYVACNSQCCRGGRVTSYNGYTWNTAVCPSADVSGTPACTVNSSPAQPGQYVSGCQYDGGISYRLGVTPGAWGTQDGNPTITYSFGDDVSCGFSRQLNVELQCNPNAAQMGPFSAAERYTCQYWVVRQFADIAQSM